MVRGGNGSDVGDGLDSISMLCSLVAGATPVTTRNKPKRANRVVADSRSNMNRTENMYEIPALLAMTWSCAVLFAGCLSSGAPTRAMYDAIERGDLGEVQRLVCGGARVDSSDSLGRSPLYQAALFGHLDIAEYLLSHGANSEQGASWKGGDTPLHVAAERGNAEMVRVLLEKGARVDSVNYYQQTPLLYASWKCHLPVVELLLAHSANVGVKDKWGATVLLNRCGEPFHWSEYRGVVAVLIQHGADVNARGGGDKNTPLMAAIWRKDREVVELLIRNGARIEDVGRNGHRPLCEAVLTGESTLVKCLLSHGANPTAKCREGTALALAMKLGDEAVVNLFLKAKGEGR